ncbi:hypothetical protein [Streptomyces sp. AHA2]|uniref:hypothetical protein n=1 Tax=Streptomyces sp. AHA2 TaxID=3064526 RepID=UPI002FE0D5E0
MHRTTTAATLLVTAAVAALAGCTTVRQPPAPGPSAPPSAPRQEDRSRSPVVQAPAREFLQRIEESHEPEPAAAPSGRAAPPAAAATDPGRPPREARAPHPRPDRPRPAARGPQRPRTGAPPDVSGPVRREAGEQVPGGTDVCALGRRYGGWRPDSPEARICRDTYGG